MKQRRLIQLVVGILLFAGLFKVLWKSSSPNRIGKQFEEQASTQLRGAKAYLPASDRLNPDHVFRSVKVESVYPDSKLNCYTIKYTIRYANLKTKGVARLDSGCRIFERDNYQGDCSTFNESPKSLGKSFKISLHP
jgi:hypothetical protein